MIELCKDEDWNELPYDVSDDMNDVASVGAWALDQLCTDIDGSLVIPLVLKRLGTGENSYWKNVDFNYRHCALACVTEMSEYCEENSVLAFQFMMHFSHGDTPLHELGRLGGNESLRGYFEGRYSERNLFVTQVEWRQKISRLWGITAFAGLGGVAPTIDQFDIMSLRPAVGVGVRFLIDTEEDLNLRLDFGGGQEKISYYFKIAEAF